VGWSWPKSKTAANGECGEARGRDLFGGKAENDQWCRSTQRFRAVGESFHAAAVIMRGGERSWILVAVSLSDDQHWSTAFGAEPKLTCVMGG